MSVCRVYSTKAQTVLVVALVGLLVWATVASMLALYCRGEWLAAARERNKQADIAYASEISAEYWFQKYRTRAYSQPGASERDVVQEMAARHRELRRKVERVAGKSR